MKLPRSEVRSDINITPLVDVCLVLLIIFMVVTPMMTKGASVAVPQTRDPEAIPETPRQILLEVEADGGISVAGRRVSPDELRQTLADLRLVDPDRPVIVKADRRLPYRQVVEVLRIASQAKIDRAGLITERHTPGT